MICYSTFFFEYFFQDEFPPSSMPYYPEHLLIFIYAGELLIEDGKEKVLLKKGDYIFIRRNIRINFTKRAYKEEKFQGVFMGFSEYYLKNFYIQNEKYKMQYDRETFKSDIIRLVYTPWMESLYISLQPYLEYQCKPCKEILELKLREGIYSLLLIDKKFYPCLFDFKITH